jgi:hypothetical protein
MNTIANYSTTLTSPNGQALAGATVSVYIGVPSSGNLATLYTDSTGDTPLANPVSTDGLGNLAFAVSNGDYTLVASGPGLAGPITWNVTIVATSSVPPLFASFTFSTDGTTVYAYNNNTGLLAYSGTDAAAVINEVLAAYATVGGRLFFKVGVYPVNSFTYETATGASNFESCGNALAYAIGIPCNVPLAVGVQWLFEGEVTSVWTGEEDQTSANTNGVIFNVTSAAISTVAAGSVLALIMQRPNTNAILSPEWGIANDVFIENITLRFPTNQLGNTIGAAMWWTDDVSYKNVVADFALPYNTIGAGPAPVVGSYNSIGLTCALPESGNVQRFERCYVTGYNIGYDFYEHVTGTNDTSIYCNYAAYFGRTGLGQQYHPSCLIKFSDQENLNGIVLGSVMELGSRLDLIAMDIELGGGSWYARSSIGAVETNVGYTAGLITYSVYSLALGGQGSATFWTVGGDSFQCNPGQPQFYPPYDIFYRANCQSLGEAWVNGPNAPSWETAASTIGISGNRAVLTGSSSGDWASWAIWGGRQNDQPGSLNQFSRISIYEAGDSDDTFCAVCTNMDLSGGTRTYYEYYASHTANGGSGLVKMVNGTQTNLSVQTGSVGANNGDTLELRNIGGWLYCLRNGVLDTNIPTNPYFDSSISGGQPGFAMVQVNANEIAINNWFGDNINNANTPSFNTAIYINGVPGVSEGSYSSITAIQTTGGIVTTLTGSSDEKLKTNVKALESGLAKISQLRPVEFTYNDKGQKKTGFKADRKAYGFIAQEVQKIMPEAIEPILEDGQYLVLNEKAIYATLVKAVQELSAEVKALKVDKK